MNIKTILSLKNKHSFRLLPVLNMLSRYGENVGKRKSYGLGDLNDMFGTNYTTLYEVQRKILAPVKEELDNSSNITFVYEVNSEKLGAGRPKATSIIIDVIERNQVQGRLSI
jgi:hypothetical protein